MTKIRYSAIGDRAYVWHVVTSHGTVIAGEVVKPGPRMSWRAEVTHDDGEPCRTPGGGVFSGYASTRGEAVERSLFPLLHPIAHYVDLMNH